MLFICSGCDNNCEIHADTFEPKGCVHPQPKQAKWEKEPEPLVLIAPENEPCIPELFLNGCKTGGYPGWSPWIKYIEDARGYPGWDYILDNARRVDASGRVWRLQHDEEGLVMVLVN